MANEERLLIDPKGAIIGDVSHFRIMFKDGRYADRKIPNESRHVTLAALFETGVPTKSETLPGLTVWIPPTEIQSVVVAETDSVWSNYQNMSSNHRKTVEKGLIAPPGKKVKIPLPKKDADES